MNRSKTSAKTKAAKTAVKPSVDIPTTTAKNKTKTITTRKSSARAAPEKKSAASPEDKGPKSALKNGMGRSKDDSYRERLPKNVNGVTILSGGNPQIPKGDGDAPVQAYIANMPGWKSDLGRHLDALIVKAAPGVKKAVKWNSPFYGIEGRGWFASFHVLTKYVKVTFFKGISLKPLPPGGTEKSGESRWIDVYENDALDEKEFLAWVRQAASVPGWDGR